MIFITCKKSFIRFLWIIPSISVLQVIPQSSDHFAYCFNSCSVFMMSSSLRREDPFRFATLTSDGFGLSSFHSNHFLHRIYRCAVFLSVFFGQFTLIKAVDNTESITFLNYARFWCFFTSSVIILILQYIREGSIRKCHRLCSQLPSVSAFRRIVFNFAQFVSHFVIYRFIQGIAFIEIFFYVIFLFFIIQIPSIQFGYLMTSIGNGITAIGVELEDFLKEENRKNLSVENTGMKKILRIHEDYMNLTNVADFLVSTYSYQLLIMFGQGTLEILFIIHITFYDILAGNQITDGNFDFALKTYLLLSYFYKLHDIITPGENYKKECKRIDRILCKLQNLCNGEFSEIREFILQRLIDPFPLSILGLFQLDYHLLYAICCGAINYGLIIGIFQLGGMENKEFH